MAMKPGSLVILLFLLVASCTPPRDAEQAGQLDTTIVLNLGGEPETMDPTLNSSLIGSRVLKGLMEGLIVLDAGARPQPAGAVSWEQSGDYRVWTFHLRKEAKWHNGDPVTAHDYVYAARRILTPSLGANYAQNVLVFLKDAREYYDAGGLNGDRPLESARALDDYTVQYQLRNPTPFFDTVVDLTCWYPLHRPTIEQHGEGWDLSPKTFMGNGPFRMTAYRSGDRIVAEKADTYWDADSIFWDKVEFYMIDNQNTENQAFKTGDIDITHRVALPQVDYWRGRPEWTPSPSFGMYYIALNNEQPPFDDGRVRKAFSKAINRELITGRLLKRGEIVAGGFVPGNLASVRGGTWREQAGNYIGTVNVDEAKQLLQEAGYGPGERFPVIEYLYDTGDDHKIIAEQLQAMWRRAFNVDVKLQNVEWGVRLQRGRSGDFFMMRSGWYGDYLDAMTFLELMETGNNLNDPNYGNPRFDELIENARREEDAVEREKMMMEAERILIEEDCAIIPLHIYSEPILVQTNIEGIVRNATGDVHYQRARRIRNAE